MHFSISPKTTPRTLSIFRRLLQVSDHAIDLVWLGIDILQNQDGNPVVSISSTGAERRDNQRQVPPSDGLLRLTGPENTGAVGWKT